MITGIWTIFTQLISGLFARIENILQATHVNFETLNSTLKNFQEKINFHLEISILRRL